jgi:glycosyl transferase family 25
MKSISEIQHAFYINLASRPDRKDHVEKQLHSIGIHSFTRFNAIKMTNGAIGCSMSHLQILQLARKENWNHVLIVEDDILFTNPAVFVTQFDAFLSNHSNDCDVVLVAGNNFGDYTTVDSTCVQITKCQTTTGYLVQRHYYDKLIHNIKTGLLHLMREPHNHRLYAIDKFWFQLQGIDKWFLITPLTVTQREDYSDIEQRATNYSQVMLTLDKSAMLQRLKDAKVLKSLGTFHF